MSLYLDTRGRASAAVAICDRCKLKVGITTLVSDPNAPGLRVCEAGCADLFDPWRLPARAPENITLRYPRPDVDIGDAELLETEALTDTDIVTEGGQQPLQTEGL